MVKLNVTVDDATRRALYHQLLDDGLSFAEWMRRQIAAYLAAAGKRAARRKRTAQ